MRQPHLVVLALLVAVGLAGCGDEEPRRDSGVPHSFFGIAPQDATGEVELARMAAGGVGSYHLLLSWPRVEFRPDRYDWTGYDQLLGQLATHDIDPIPYAFGTPAHYAESTTVPPTASEDALRGWETFLTMAAERYGPGGSFWERFEEENPDIEPKPLRIWEIWNEVNGPAFWNPDPSPSEYATLLKRSQRTIQKVNPRARIMVAGMFATPSNDAAITSFDFIRELYEKPRVAEAVDLVGVHPYGPSVEDVRDQIEATREIVDEAGDEDAALFVTEIGWGSDPDLPSQLTVSRPEQARLLRRAYKMMIRKREDWDLKGALWYTWRDPTNPAGLCGWCASAGLLDDDLDPKPAWYEYAELAGGDPGP